MNGKRITALLLSLLLLLCLCACGQEPETPEPGEEETIYTVRFDLNGGTKVSGRLTQKLEEGEAAVAPEVTREGYSFAGWDKDFSGVTKDMTVTALWSRQVTVTFELDGGMILAGNPVQQLNEGEMPSAPTPVKTGYTFLGWSPSVGTAKEDTVYTALWERTVLSAEEVYALVSPSVVEITVYDKNKNAFATGTGFFMDDKGTMVTNYHVMEDARYADVLTDTGKTYDISGVLAYSKALDLAIVQCAWKSPQYLTFCEEGVKTGETVYAMGSSNGWTGTFSEGIVSTANRIVDGKNCIQTTAPISHGNSGGPLVNRYGEVVGINSMMDAEGTNLGFAIKIGELGKLTETPMTMEEFYNATVSAPEEGNVWNDICEYADCLEQESNDTLATAHELESGMLWGGILDANGGDIDVYAVYLKAGQTASAAYMNYYTEDDDYIIPGFCDGEVNELAYFALDDGCWCLNYTAQTDGWYYIVVYNNYEDYPYEDGAYYLVGTDIID